MFCPTAGDPYKDKLTLFACEDDFAASTNRGFVPLGSGGGAVRGGGEQSGSGRFRVRLEDGLVMEGSLDEGDASLSSLPEGFAAVMGTVVRDYAYLLR